MGILIVFNFIYCAINPDVVNVMFIGALTGLVATVLATAVVGGVTVLGTGLTGESVHIIFSVSALLNMMFKINIAGMSLGIGLINNVLGAFETSDFGGVGFFIASTLSMLILVSGLMTIIGGSD